jgi:hypothetical protein
MKPPLWESEKVRPCSHALYCHDGVVDELLPHNVHSRENSVLSPGLCEATPANRDAGERRRPGASVNPAVEGSNPVRGGVRSAADSPYSGVYNGARTPEVSDSPARRRNTQEGLGPAGVRTPGPVASATYKNRGSNGRCSLSSSIPDPPLAGHLLPGVGTAHHPTNGDDHEVRRSGASGAILSLKPVRL